MGKDQASTLEICEEKFITVYANQNPLFRCHNIWRCTGIYHGDIASTLTFFQRLLRIHLLLLCMLPLCKIYGQSQFWVSFRYRGFLGRHKTCTRPQTVSGTLTSWSHSWLKRKPHHQRNLSFCICEMRTAGHTTSQHWINIDETTLRWINVDLMFINVVCQ